MTKRGKILEHVTIEDYAAEARCIARVDDLVIFVENTAPGDVADLRITRKKKNYLDKIIRFLQAYTRLFQEILLYHIF